MNNRLKKKCFIGATSLHLLLIGILFFGSGFLSSQDKSADRPLIDFVPLQTIDEALSGGGNPHGGAPPPPPAPQPPAQPPAPQPPPRVQAAEPPKPVTQITHDPESFTTKPAKKLPKVSTELKTRSKGKTTSKQKTTSDSKADERATQLARAARSAAQNLRDELSGSTTIELRGPGGGGVPYANFLDAVKKIYSDAWIVPDGVTDEEATATATVTIARDGTVKSSRILRTSGNALADQSVEAVLRRVRVAVPLPDGAKEDERTVTIKFNVKAKRGFG
jgi:TonB family protein